MRARSGWTNGARATAAVRAGDAARRLVRSLERRSLPDESVVWLVGPPRSGTTWLLGMLRAHPLVAGVNEPLLGAHLGVTNVASAPETTGDERLLQHVVGGRAEYVFAERDAGVWVPLVGDLARRAVLARHRGTTAAGGRIVVKEPHGAQACGVLHQVFPGSRFLFLVRDPRDVLDSVHDIVVSGWSGRGGGGWSGQVDGVGALDDAERRRLFEAVGSRWRLTVAEMSALHDRLPDHQRLLVRYEDLRADPGALLERITRWTGLDVAPGWASQTARLLDFDALPEDQRGPGRFHRAATPGLWRQRLTAEDAAWASEFFARELARHGYDA